MYFPICADSNTTQETPLKDTSLSPAVYGPIVAGGVLSIIVIIPVLIILCKSELLLSMSYLKETPEL